MNYFELKITGPSDCIGPVTDLLMKEGFDSFQIDDPKDARDVLSQKKTFEWDYYEPSLVEERDAAVTLYFEENDTSIQEMVYIAGCIGELRGRSEDAVPAVTVRRADDSEWKDEWKQYFKPSHITDHIVVRPSWEAYEPAQGEQVIELDPGMAFGTGTHATTRMCVEFLDEYITSERTVMDIGCGSGILSIASALCGAEEVYGFDIDPDAVQAATENTEKNGMSHIVEIAEGDVTAGLSRKADIVAANLMAELVAAIAPSVAEHLQGPKLFISSGIITEKRSMVEQSLKDAGFQILEVREQDGWCAIASSLL